MRTTHARVHCALFAFACVALLGARVLAERGSQAQQSVSDFNHLTKESKQGLLQEVLDEPGPLARDRITDVLGAALGDSDVTVRERALWTIARRTGSPRSVAVWTDERPAFVSLRTPVIRLLGDSDVRVRDSAVAALCGIEHNPSAPREHQRVLSDESATILLSSVSTAVAGPERARRVSVFGGFKVSSALAPRRDGMLAVALSDDAPVAAAAAIAVSQLHSVRHLPGVVGLLAHQSAAVRVHAAQAVASFGPEARRYLPQMERALQVETDEVAKRSLEGALASVTRQK